MKYKFRFLRDRFACRIPKADKTFVDIDVTDGFFQTDDKEVADILIEKSKQTGSLVLSLNSVNEKIETHQPRVKVVSGARSSKDSEGETK